MDKAERFYAIDLGLPELFDVYIADEVDAETKRLREEIARLRKALEEIQKEAKALQEQGGSTLQFKEQIKARLDGFLMTITEIATEALKEGGSE